MRALMAEDLDDLFEGSEFAPGFEEFEDAEGVLDWVKSIGTGAATGATTGLVAGPWGALVGGVAGAGIGAVSQAVSDRKPQPRQPQPAPRPQPAARPTPQPRPPRRPARRPQTPSRAGGRSTNSAATVRQLLPLLTRLVSALASQARRGEDLSDTQFDHAGFEHAGHDHHAFRPHDGVIDLRTGKRIRDTDTESFLTEADIDAENAERWQSFADWDRDTEIAPAERAMPEFALDPANLVQLRDENSVHEAFAESAQINEDVAGPEDPRLEEDVDESHGDRIHVPAAHNFGDADDFEDTGPESSDFDDWEQDEFEHDHADNHRNHDDAIDDFGADEDEADASEDDSEDNGDFF